MAANLKPRRTVSGRALLEWSASAPSGSPLTVDRAAGVIHGVKVLGFRSRNSHGLKEATNGTEYTRRCMEDALPLYEGVDVLVSHKAKLPATGREDDAFGQLRNVTLAADGIRADLHYLKSHSMAERVCEDVERGLGVFGLSHDASAKSERFDRAGKRLIIESLAIVRSVDLVRKPATNRNLWESDQTMKTTLRELLEGLELTPVRTKWRKRLLEDDTMAPTLDAPMDAPPAGEEGDAAWDGFMQEIMTLGDKFKAGEVTAQEAGKKVAAFFKSHDSLFGDDEPAAPSDSSSDTPPAKSDDDKTEAAKENRELKHKLAVRELCEELKVSPDRTLLESLEALPIDQGRKLVEREKARGTGGRPSGAGAHGNKPPANKPPAKKPRGAAFLDAISE